MAETKKKVRKKRALNHRDKGGGHKKVHSEKKKVKKTNKFFNVILDILFFSIVILILSSSFLFMISQKEDKTLFGYRFYNVLTNSMVKTKDDQKGNFSADDMIIVKSIAPTNVEVGDIITFVPNIESQNTYLTHRVIKRIEAEGDTKEKIPDFITQGDANNSPDPQISGESIIGKKVLVLPKAGKLISLVRENIVLSLIFVISLCLLIFVMKGYFEESIDNNSTRRKKNEKIKKK